MGTEPWIDAHARGRDAVERAFGDRVVTEFVERVGHDVDPDETIERLVAEGYELIFATSFPLSQATSSAAERHPDVHFDQARGLHTLDNLGTFAGADEEPLYLAGIAAAATSRSGVLGFVGASPEPETVRHINAFALGAQSVRPGVRVAVAWIGEWWNPEVERELARQLVAMGADVLATGSISTATGDVAREADVGWVGHDADHVSEYPDVWISAAVPSWDDYYTRQVRDQLAGDWAPSAYYGDMADGFTELAALGERVPESARQLVDERRDAIIDGRLDPFDGPIKDQVGDLRVVDGSKLSFSDKMTVDWFVEGVSGRIPPVGERLPPSF